MKLDKKTQMSIAYAVLTLLVLFTMQNYLEVQVEGVDYSSFRQKVASGQVNEITIGTEVIRGTFIEGGQERSFETYRVNDPELVSLLDTHGVKYGGARENTWFLTLLSWILPAVFFVGIWMFMARRMGGGSGGLMSIGKSKAKVYMEKGTGITFDDVAGIDEAKEELQEIVEFLKTPERFQALGGKIPRGVMLVGPPGTGKTLLAKAVAGEAGVPFFSISGSDFVEMFVGVGAARVRDLFEQAKKHAPAIIFIDELDALGKARGAASFGGHDEREQTLNQLLVEMDGFDVSTGVILIAATNRPDILDPALLRPGRFDRQIVVDRPDLEGRRNIAKVHAAGKPLDDDVSTDVIARRTPGFTGADIANLLNEAALLAARRDKPTISQQEIEDAIDRVIAGPERKSRAMSDKEKTVIAYHEAGHALVGHVLPNTDPIHKISIVARGRALGWTLALPTQDRYLQSRSELTDTMAMLLGGRTAEELIFGDPTTGASDDIDRVATIARSMVTEYGMSDALGPQRLGNKSGEVFLGKDQGHEADYSEDVATQIDSEVRALVEAAHIEAREILALHRSVLDRLAEGLIEHESLEGDALEAILAEAGGAVENSPAGASSHPTIESPQPAEQMRAEGLD